MTISRLFEETFGPLGTEDAILGEYAAISQNTSIQGNITSSESLVIQGVVRGDVISETQILLQGKVQGTVRCKNLLLQGGAVEGNLHVTGDLILDNETVVIGDLFAQNIYIEGKVKGQIVAAEKVALQGQCFVVGDITGGSFVMDPGSKLNGFVKIQTQSANEMGEFPELSF